MSALISGGAESMLVNRCAVADGICHSWGDRNLFFAVPLPRGTLRLAKRQVWEKAGQLTIKRLLMDYPTTLRYRIHRWQSLVKLCYGFRYSLKCLFQIFIGVCGREPYEWREFVCAAGNCRNTCIMEQIRSKVCVGFNGISVRCF